MPLGLRFAAFPISGDRMGITRKQFIEIAPKADQETVDDLFALGADGQPEINRILAECNITEPPVVAQFLACCSLATDRFTKFHFGNLGVDVITWLSHQEENNTYPGEQGRAHDFQDYQLHDAASEWDWLTVADCCATLFPITERAWLEVNNRLTEICAVLGIKDESEKFALEA